MSAASAVVDLGSALSPQEAAACALSCRHCGAELSAPTRDGFCCTGCRVVHGLLATRGLTRYYDLRGGAISPALAPTSTRDRKWLDAIEAELREAPAARRVSFDLQGVQCAACVWLIDELFERQEPASARLSCTTNPALGRVEVLVTKDFPLRAWIVEVERFGYLLGPARKSEAPRSSDLLWRLGVCAALAMNAMLFSIPVSLGLRAGAVYHVFRWLGMLLAGASVLVGGSVFIRSAWRCVRRGVLHMDVPIALGILLAYGGSLWHFTQGRDDGSFFDTVATFIALMLTGRWLQERVVERNKAMLLASDGVDSLLARRVREGRVEVVPCGDLHLGDTVLVAPGDLIPAASTLDDASASCSLDWINGESAPRAFQRGALVPAGAFNLGVSAITLTTTEDFADSVLPSLLRSTRDDSTDSARATAWWQRLTRTYVLAVLSLAALCFLYWAGARHDLAKALQATTALLVVTCPCAFGIATPTAYELAQSGLRRAGMFIRSASLLDRLPEVRRVVFDKTGTLTEGVLELVDPERLATLSDRDRTALYNIVVRSTHPKSVAVRRAFEASTLERLFVADRAVTETPGAGLELVAEGCTWRLGRADWAAPDAGVASADLVFARDGAVVTALSTAEVLRPDARAEIGRLRASGLDVWMLSGDEASRARAMAAALGIDDDHAVGGASPDDKAAWIVAHDQRNTWMIGDGINDGPAVEKAFCSATPAADRPFMPARTDAWFVSPGLRPVRLALRVSRALAAVNRRNLAVATLYNMGTVTLSFAGLMSPILCAVIMPLTSLSIILATIASLSPQRSLWRS
jgi:Cu2+-exporting ATPase